MLNQVPENLEKRLTAKPDRGVTEIGADNGRGLDCKSMGYKGANSGVPLILILELLCHLR